jgi:hypothetical protein
LRCACGASRRNRIPYRVSAFLRHACALARMHVPLRAHTYQGQCNWLQRWRASVRAFGCVRRCAVADVDGGCDEAAGAGGFTSAAGAIRCTPLECGITSQSQTRHVLYEVLGGPISTRHIRALKRRTPLAHAHAHAHTNSLNDRVQTHMRVHASTHERSHANTRAHARTHAPSPSNTHTCARSCSEWQMMTESQEVVNASLTNLVSLTDKLVAVAEALNERALVCCRRALQRNCPV